MTRTPTHPSTPLHRLGATKTSPLRARALTRRLVELPGRDAALDGLTDRGRIALLSIGKLAASQAKYYLEQARGRVDVIQSVAGGAEDYYAHAKEARGVWLGRGAAQLALGGVVGAEELRRLLGRMAPEDRRCGCAFRAARSASPRST